MIQTTQGKLGFAAYLGCLILTYLVYAPQPSPKKRQLFFGLLGCAAAAVLIALWLFFDVMSSKSQISGSGGDLGQLRDFVQSSFSVSTGIGTYVTLLAALAAGAGAGMKAKEEKLF